MQPPADFLTKGFPPFKAKMWCELEQDTTSHEVEFVANKDNRVSYYKTCVECKQAYDKLKRLGVDKPNPRKADVMPVTEYVFLLHRPEDVIA